jgi:phage gp46-like protein
MHARAIMYELLLAICKTHLPVDSTAALCLGSRSRPLANRYRLHTVRSLHTVQAGMFLQRSQHSKIAARAAAPSTEGPIIVWYKHDLRTHDHPGLSQSISTGRAVICFFCFDTRVLSDQLTHLWGPAAVQGAVTDLRKQLDKLNCLLVVRQGYAEEQLLNLVKATGASEIICHSEVEEKWVQLQDAVEQGAHCNKSQHAETL